MGGTLHRVVIAWAGMLLAACTGTRAEAQHHGFTMTVADLRSHDDVPQRYTCIGEGVSPRITWSEVPEGTRSIALVVEDPDAPNGTFAHWLVYDVPPDATLDTGRPKQRQLEGGAKQGQNDYGHVGWGPPCPPPGHAHRYRFTLYALDDTPDLPPAADRGSVQRAIDGHVLAEDTVTLRFAR